MHKIFVQRKKAKLNFRTRKPTNSVIPPNFIYAQLGGVTCLCADHKYSATPDAEFGFEITTLVLTTLVAPVTVTGQTFEKGPRYTEDIVELYLMNIASSNAPGVRTPAQWHNCINASDGGFSYTGKWGCPLIITGPPANQMIIHYLSGVYQYGIQPNNQPLTTVFDHYLIQMVLPNQTLCYYAVPNTQAGEAHILHIQNKINDAAPNVPLAVGAESQMLFYDDLQMLIFDQAIFDF